MLVLTRNQDQSIQIGDDIEIKVIEVKGNQVKLGIEAPAQIDIHRQEVYVDIKEQNNEAAKVPDELLHLLNLKDK